MAKFSRFDPRNRKAFSKKKHKRWDDKPFIKESPKKYIKRCKTPINIEKIINYESSE